jgi:hypothetical protein
MIRVVSNSIFTGVQPGNGEGKTTSLGGYRSPPGGSRDEVHLNRSEKSENPYSQLQRRALKQNNSATGSQAADRAHDLSRAINALPMNSKGQINPDALVDDDKLTSLSQAVERLVLEGFGSGAEVAFDHAVGRIFAEYADDLELDEGEIERAKDLMTQDVKQVIANTQVRPWDPSQPAPASMDLESEIKSVQEKVLARRRLLLEASGDLSRVLSELTVHAREGGDEEYAELGGFLDRFGDAIRARSSKTMRDSARDQLLSTDPLVPSQPDASSYGEAFIRKVAQMSI